MVWEPEDMVTLVIIETAPVPWFWGLGIWGLWDWGQGLSILDICKKVSDSDTL